MSNAGYIRATLLASKIILQMKYPYIKQGYEDGIVKLGFLSVWLASSQLFFSCK